MSISWPVMRPCPIVTLIQSVFCFDKCFKSRLVFFHGNLSGESSLLYLKIRRISSSLFFLDFPKNGKRFFVDFNRWNDRICVYLLNLGISLTDLYRNNLKRTKLGRSMYCVWMCGLRWYTQPNWFYDVLSLVNMRFTFVRGFSFIFLFFFFFLFFHIESRFIARTHDNQSNAIERTHTTYVKYDELREREASNTTVSNILIIILMTRLSDWIEIKRRNQIHFVSYFMRRMYSYSTLLFVACCLVKSQWRPNMFATPSAFHTIIIDLIVLLTFVQQSWSNISSIGKNYISPSITRLQQFCGTSKIL